MIKLKILENNLKIGQENQKMIECDDSLSSRNLVIRRKGNIIIIKSYTKKNLNGTCALRHAKNDIMSCNCHTSLTHCHTKNSYFESIFKFVFKTTSNVE